MEGSGLSLPLNLANIAARCKGSYYAPRRFAVSLTASNSHTPLAMTSCAPVRKLTINVTLSFSFAFDRQSSSHSQARGRVYLFSTLEDW